jgi:hypothetical protein
LSPQEPPAAAQTTALEELEAEAYERLQRKAKVLKRPASCQPAAKATKVQKAEKAAPKAKLAGNSAATPKAKAKGKGKTTFGCPRCRGNVNGCATCLQPGYNGLRLPGRQAWHDYMAKRAKKA